MKTRNNRHAVAIAEALLPNPSDWKFAGIVEEDGKCVCGAAVKRQYLLENKVDGRVAIIGSTCIVETVPYLRLMNAGELADAIEYALSQPTFKELEQALYLACQLDNWVLQFQMYLPPYFRSFGSTERPWIACSASDRDIGVRARSVRARIRHFFDRVPLARKFAEGRFLWVDPPKESKAPDGWLKTRLEVERVLFEKVLPAMSKLPFYSKEREKLAHLTLIPDSIGEMCQWLKRVEDVLTWILGCDARQAKSTLLKDREYAKERLEQLRDQLINIYADENLMLLSFQKHTSPRGDVELQKREGRNVFVVARKAWFKPMPNETWICRIDCKLFDSQYKTVYTVIPQTRLRSLQCEIYKWKQHLASIEAEINGLEVEAAA